MASFVKELLFGKESMEHEEQDAVPIDDVPSDDVLSFADSSEISISSEISDNGDNDKEKDESGADDSDDAPTGQVRYHLSLFQFQTKYNEISNQIFNQITNYSFDCYFQLTF